MTTIANGDIKKKCTAKAVLKCANKNIVTSATKMCWFIQCYFITHQVDEDRDAQFYTPEEASKSLKSPKPHPLGTV